MTETQPEYIETTGGKKLAFRKSPGTKPAVVFLGGFHSNMQGIKATTLESWCQTNGHEFIRFDYRGHGESDGEFELGCIGDWSRDALSIVDAVTRGPLILVGSSMGAWIMLLVALQRPERIAGLLGIASAADFTEVLFHQRLSAQERQTLISQGRVERPSAYDASPYVYTKRLVEDGRRHLLLEKPIEIDAPLRLVHSTDDPDVPWQTSQKIARQVISNDVQLTLLKDAGHRLSRPADLNLILSMLENLIQTSSQ